MICSYEASCIGRCESTKGDNRREMLKCLGARKDQNLSNGHLEANLERDGEDVTDDPLAAMDLHLRGKQIYSVSRSVYLPRVTIKRGYFEGGGINPLFNESLDCTVKKQSKNKKRPDCRTSPQFSNQSGEKSSSSGYGGSNGGSSNEPCYCDQLKVNEDSVAISNQSPVSTKSTGYARGTKSNKSLPSTSSYSSSSGTLNTIHEDVINFSIPRPIWPRRDSSTENSRSKYDDSINNDTFYLYRNVNYYPYDTNTVEFSIKEVLTDMLGHIQDTIEGRNGVTSEEMLKHVNERISLSLQILKDSTEEEMKQLCINLSKSKEINSVVRAFSNSSYKKRISPVCNEDKTSESEEVYQTPSSGTSSSVSSNSSNNNNNRPYATVNGLPVFVHEGLSSVPNGVRNAMIYGTLCRVNQNSKSKSDRFSDKDRLCEKASPKKSLLKAVNDDKPSVWEQYYGVRMVPKEKVKQLAKPSDIPLFPGGRPEADFTLDMPRSELLSKKMKADKKWRCRCRLLTTFLGFVFFLLSVMAVSLMLTRGKRMFGSMV